MSKSKDGKHLESTFCIIDINGIEKVVFDRFDHGSIRGCIYSLNNKYYNIETGELYCRSYSSMESKEYLFLKDDVVMKINKITGTYEIFH